MGIEPHNRHKTHKPAPELGQMALALLNFKLQAVTVFLVLFGP